MLLRFLNIEQIRSVCFDRVYHDMHFFSLRYVLYRLHMILLTRLCLLISFRKICTPMDSASFFGSEGSEKDF